jgi:hypothetical protein
MGLRNQDGSFIGGQSAAGPAADIGIAQGGLFDFLRGGQANAGGFLSNPNARIGGTGFDAAGAALAAKPSGGIDLGNRQDYINLINFRKANPHLKPKWQGPGAEPDWFKNYWGGGGRAERQNFAH